MKGSSQNYLLHEIKNHWFAYLILCLGLALMGTAYIYFWPNREYQRAVIIGLGIFYFLWGVVTHFKSQKITLRVISEYFAISLLAGGLLYFLTL